MTKYTAFLFDLDGVIVDTARYHYVAWRKIANQLGFDLSLEENELLKGISRMESLEIILKLGNVTLTQAEKDKLAAQKNADYLQLCSAMTPGEVLPGVREFMDQLKREGMKIGLGSASKNARMILKQVNMLLYFDTIVDGTRITKGKPDPEVFLMGAQDLAVPADSCVVFEDAAAGIEAAKAGGMFAVGVGDPEVLVGADKVIGSFSGLSLDDFVGN